MSRDGRAKAADDRELPDDVVRALGDLPVFPLPEAVLFPGAELALHIFEPRYRAMLAHCLAKHRALVIARLLDDGGGTPPRFATVGGLGLIVQHHALPDGRSNILLVGRARVALEERPSDDPFRRVRASILPDVEGPIAGADVAALVSAATAFAAELLKRARLGFVVPTDATPQAISDLCAQHLLFAADVRQAVLEERDVARRVRRVTTELALQLQALGGAKRDERSSLN